MSEHECNGDCGHCAHAAEEKQDAVECRVRHNLKGVRNAVVVLSGKGGVGKSTVAANLAAALALAGKRVGLAVEDPDAAIVWRGPMKLGVIQQFLMQVDWGELDWLVVDAPPGTGDEPLTVCQSLPDPLGAIVVTTPQKVAAADVSRSLAFCDQLMFPVVGIVENMSGFVCPHCGEKVEIFSSGAAEELARKYDAPILGRIPLDPTVCASGDAGVPFMRDRADTPVGRAFAQIVAALEKAAAERPAPREK